MDIAKAENDTRITSSDVNAAATETSEKDTPSKISYEIAIAEKDTPEVKATATAEKDTASKISTQIAIAEKDTPEVKATAAATAEKNAPITISEEVKAAAPSDQDANVGPGHGEVQDVGDADADELPILEDNGVRKRILLIGRGVNTPKEGEIVRARIFWGRIGDIAEDQNFLYDMDVAFAINGEEYEIYMGSADCLVTGLVLGLMTMSVGELARLRVSPDYAFGTYGNSSEDFLMPVPPNATVVFVVELIAINGDRKFIDEKKLRRTWRGGFYQETDEISGMSYVDVFELRRKLGIVIKGFGLLKPIQTWGDCLRADIRKKLEEIDWKDPTPLQCQLIPLLLRGRDVIVSSDRVNLGRRVAYLIPLLEHMYHRRQLKKKVVALVLTHSETEADAIKQNLDQLHGIRDLSFKAAKIYREIPHTTLYHELRLNPSVVIGTPGKISELLDPTSNIVVDLKQVGYIVIDGSPILTGKKLHQVREIIDMTRNDRQLIVCSNSEFWVDDEYINAAGLINRYSTQPVKISM